MLIPFAFDYEFIRILIFGICMYIQIHTLRSYYYIEILIGTHYVLFK